MYFEAEFLPGEPTKKRSTQHQIDEPKRKRRRLISFTDSHDDDQCTQVASFKEDGLFLVNSFHIILHVLLSGEITEPTKKRSAQPHIDEPKPKQQRIVIYTDSDDDDDDYDGDDLAGYHVTEVAQNGLFLQLVSHRRYIRFEADVLPGEMDESKNKKSLPAHIDKSKPHNNPKQYRINRKVINDSRDSGNSPGAGLFRFSIVFA